MGVTPMSIHLLEMHGRDAHATGMKSTPDEIRARFDADVERFSNLETGQSATIDAPLVLDLVTSAAAATNPNATSVLDVGCGAGNYTLKLLEKLPNLSVTLIDLSQPMLDRAVQRITAAGARNVTPLKGDVRELSLPDNSFDVILAAAVLHHLRTDDEWLAVFRTFHRVLRPGGSVWIADLVKHATPAVQELMWNRYGDYLLQLGGAEYRHRVFAYIDKEDSPRDVMFQIDTMRRAGFPRIEILHKNSVFAAFGAIRD
jgi:tRNA (cmo5U34)-methyltransferase